MELVKLKPKIITSPVIVRAGEWAQHFWLKASDNFGNDPLLVVKGRITIAEGAFLQHFRLEGNGQQEIGILYESKAQANISGCHFEHCYISNVKIPVIMDAHNGWCFGNYLSFSTFDVQHFMEMYGNCHANDIRIQAQVKKDEEIATGVAVFRGDRNRIYINPVDAPIDSRLCELSVGAKFNTIYGPFRKSQVVDLDGTNKIEAVRD